MTIGITCALCTAGQAFGAYNCYTSASSLPSGYRSSSLGQKGSNCASTQRMYWCSPNDQACDGYTTCATCPSGYQMCGVSGSGSMCNTITYYDCKTSCSTGGGDPEEPDLPNCRENFNCVDDGGFTEASGGMMTRTYRYCNTTTDTCEIEMIEYICANGYYGVDEDNPLLATFNACKRCPLEGMTNASSVSITACFLPPGSVRTDDFGEYIIHSPNNCYWEE